MEGCLGKENWAGGPEGGLGCATKPDICTSQHKWPRVSLGPCVWSQVSRANLAVVPSRAPLVYVLRHLIPGWTLGHYWATNDPHLRTTAIREGGR